MSLDAIRGDLVPFAVGVLLLFVGLAALAGGLLRLGARLTLTDDLTLLVVDFDGVE